MTVAIRNNLRGLVSGAAVAIAAGAPALAANDFIPPEVLTVSPTGVNISDRSLLINQTDLKIGSLTLDRSGTIGARNTEVSPNTIRRWVNNFEIYVKQTTVTTKGPPTRTLHHAIVHLGAGASGAYDMAYNVSPIFVSPDSEDAYEGRLELSGTSYVFTDKTGAVYSFSGANYQLQRVANIVYANGSRLNFLRDGTGRLKAVTSTDGYAIVFDYVADGVSAACGYNLSQTYVTASSTCTGAALKVSYGYTSGTLSSVTDVVGGITYYDTVAPVGSGSFGFCVRPPGYSTCKITSTFLPTYAVPGAQGVVRQDLIDGSVWQFNGGDPSIRDPDYGSDEGSNYAGMTDPNGKITYFEFTKSSPYAMTDPNGKKTEYRFTGGQGFQSFYYSPTQGKLLMRVMLPEGNEYSAFYSTDNFNLMVSQTWKAKPGSGIADRTQTLTYPSCDAPNTRQNCVHATAMVDGKGSTTNWVYTSYGSVLSEMQPPPTSGAARPLKLYTYVQKYAYIRNSGGSLVAAGAPIWMLDTATICQTVAGSSSPICDSSAPQVRTAYEYGADAMADSLLVRGIAVTDFATSTTLRTCYRYDGYGRKISETKPTAGFSVCP